jgi:hypothetical protein
MQTKDFQPGNNAVVTVDAALFENFQKQFEKLLTGAKRELCIQMLSGLSGRPN